MPAVVILGVLAVAGLPHLWLVLRRGGGDVPALIAAGAASWLPAHLREWGQAMAAELAQIPDRADRWRFAAGVLRVALFPPARHRRRVLLTAFAGLAASAAVTAAAAGVAPPVTVFAAALGLLLGGCATVATWRSASVSWTARQVTVAAVATAGVAASVTDAVWVAVFHPVAITASKNAPAYSVVLAVLLAACLVAALSLPRGGHAKAVLSWGLGGMLASGTFYAVVAAVTGVAGVAGAPLVVCLATAPAVAARVSATTGSRSAGVRAGLLVAALSAPLRFSVDLTTLLVVHRYTLTDGYDIAAFPHSGYPDVASYLLSNVLGGAILGGMLITSVLTIAATLLGAAAGTRPSRPGLRTGG